MPETGSFNPSGAKNCEMKSEIIIATEDDLACIRTWLREERDQGERGFKCNWSIIEEGFTEGRLVVIRDPQSAVAVAFRVGGLLSPSIMEVHPSHRKRGYGAEIVEYFIEQARKESVNVLVVQCQPRTSIPFWKAMGFTLYGEAFGPKIDSYYERHAFKVLKYDLPISESGVPTLVNIEFREDREILTPFESRPVRGRWVDNTIHLEERLVAYFPFRIGCGDVYCRIRVGDIEVYSDKMKRDRFREIGFRYEEHSAAYFSDKILIGAKAASNANSHTGDS